MCGNEFLYMDPGFSRKIILKFPEITATTSTNCRIHDAGTTIVCSDHQKPVIIKIVQAGEITCCSNGAFGEVSSFIHLMVYFKSKSTRSFCHELPGTCSTHH